MFCWEKGSISQVLVVALYAIINQLTVYTGFIPLIRKSFCRVFRGQPALMVLGAAGQFGVKFYRCVRNARATREVIVLSFFIHKLLLRRNG
jgi:hypothetical protein